MADVWFVIGVLAIVSGISGAALVLLVMLDSAVEAVRMQLVTGRGPAARLARRLRLPLAAMLPSVVYGCLAWNTTGLLTAGVATAGVIAVATLALFLALGR